MLLFFFCSDDSKTITVLSNETVWHPCLNKIYIFFCLNVLKNIFLLIICKKVLKNVTNILYFILYVTKHLKKSTTFGTLENFAKFYFFCFEKYQWYFFVNSKVYDLKIIKKLVFFINQFFITYFLWNPNTFL